MNDVSLVVVSARGRCPPLPIDNGAEATTDYADTVIAPVETTTDGAGMVIALVNIGRAGIVIAQVRDIGDAPKRLVMGTAVFDVRAVVYANGTLVVLANAGGAAGK